MARIPQLNEQQRLNPSAPVRAVSTGSARIKGESFEALVKGLGAVGNAVSREIEKQEKIAFDTQTTKLHMDVSRASLESSEAAEKMSKDSYGRDIKDLSQKEFETRVSGITKNYDKNVVDQFRPKLEQYKGNLDITSLKKSIEFKTAKNNQDEQEIRSRTGNEVYMDPENAHLHAQSYFNYLENVADAGQIGGPKKEEWMFRGRKEFSEKYVEGLLDKKMYKQALKALKMSPPEIELLGKEADILAVEAEAYGNKKAKRKLDALKPEDGELPIEVQYMLGGLEAQDRARLTRQVNKKIESDLKEELAQLSGQVRGFKQLAYAGQVDDATYKKLRGQIETNPVIGEDREYTLYDLDLARQFGQASKAALTSHPSKWQAEIPYDGTPGDMVKKSLHQQAQQKLRSGLQHILDAREKAPVDFVLGNFPDIQNAKERAADGDPEATGQYVEKLLERQRTLGIQNQRVLPKAESKAIGERVAASPTAQEAVEHINALEYTYGEHFGQVMGDLVRDNPKMADYQVATHFASPDAREMVIDTVKFGKDIRAEFKKENSIDVEAVDSEVKRELDPYLGALNRNSRSGAAQGVSRALRTQISTQAQREMIQDPSLQVEEAVARVSQAILGDMGDPVEVSRSRVLVPPQYASPMSKSTIGAYIQAYSDNPTAFRELGVRVPEGFKRQQKERLKLLSADYSDAVVENKFYEQVSESAEWITADDLSGIILQVPNVDGEMVTLRDQEGNPIRKSFAEIQATSDPRVMNALGGGDGRTAVEKMEDLERDREDMNVLELGGY